MAAPYAEIRAGFKTKYDELLAARRWLNTEGRRLSDSAGPLQPVVVNTMGFLDRLIWSGAKQYEQFAEIEFDFPQIAERDVQRWLEIHNLAQQMSDVTRRLATDGSDALKGASTGTAQGAQGVAVGGRGYPNRGHTYPWNGISGDNYRSQIPRQADPAEQFVLYAQRSVDLLNAAGREFARLLLALWNLLVADVVFVLAIIAAIVSAISSLVLTVAGVAAAAASITYAIYQRLAVYYPALRAYEVRRETFDRTLPPFQTQLTNMLERRNPAFDPNNTWPDPTKDLEFPHMTRGTDGHSKVSTLPQFD
jgi:hypothetical protein